MSRTEEYRRKLRDLENWDSYLLQESNLPGPRANLELAFAVAAEGKAERFLRYATFDPERAPPNSKEEFLAFCGVLGLGYSLVRDGMGYLGLIRKHAADPRWRIREAVALGLQQHGKEDMESLLRIADSWSEGTPWERRAVVAALCEPDLLSNERDAAKVLDILDRITTAVPNERERRSEAFRVLRKALGYGWSVAIVAQPEIGKPRFEKWVSQSDKDLRWIATQNLKKKRLLRLDPAWVKEQLESLSG